MTAWVTGSPKYASASRLSFFKISAEISSGVKLRPRIGIVMAPALSPLTGYVTNISSWETSEPRRPMKRLTE
jgi:hypothetical protein